MVFKFENKIKEVLEDKKIGTKRTFINCTIGNSTIRKKKTLENQNKIYLL